MKFARGGSLNNFFGANIIIKYVPGHPRGDFNSGVGGGGDAKTKLLNSGGGRKMYENALLVGASPRVENPLRMYLYGTILACPICKYTLTVYFVEISIFLHDIFSPPTV